MSEQSSEFLLVLVCFAVAGMPLYLTWGLNWLAGVFLKWEDRKQAKKDFLKRLKR